MINKEPEWEAYDPQMAWKWHDWANKRIEGLEKELEDFREALRAQNCPNRNCPLESTKGGSNE